MAIERSDEFIRSESGGETFQELFRLLTAQPNTQDLLNAINGKRTETVESLVQSYREQVGLDLITADEAELEVKTASIKKAKPISQRHKLAEPKVLILLQQDPALLGEVESLCTHSGGHKSNHALIDLLRERLGKDDVSLSDPELHKFLDELKTRVKQPVEHHHHDPGAVGTRSNSTEDNAADYHGNK
jgi:hypothetical protein